MRKFRAAVVSVVLVVGGLAVPTAAHADPGRGSSGDNVVSVENYRDRASRARSRAVVTHARSEVVDNQNIGSAYASCTDCRTVAAAVQVVMVETTPTEFRPLNLAVAVNEECLRCETFAYARQFVFQPGDRVSLSDDAEDEIEDIGEEISQVVRSPLAFPEMTAYLDVLAEELAEVVRQDIERSSTVEDEDDRRDVDEDDDDEDDD